MTEQILKYQQIDEELRAIEIELGKSEERQKVSQAKKFLDAAPERLDKLETRAGELLNASEGYKQRYQTVLENLKYIETGGEDLEAIAYNKKSAEKLHAALKELKHLLDGVLAEMAQISDGFDKLKNQTIQMQRQFKEYRQKYADLKAEKEKEAEQVQKRLNAAAKDIEPAILEKYQKKRADKIFPVFYELNGNKCGQCGIELYISNLSRLKSQKIIECENCRRMIYVKE